jgi:hypothetical protein
MTDRKDVDIEACYSASESLEYSNIVQDLGAIVDDIDAKLAVSSGGFANELLAFNESLRRLSGELEALYAQTGMLFRKVNDIWKTADEEAAKNIQQ